ncbi:hypothetical protein JCM17846_06470 [Iodidimonas nitroreducens]|uniref:HPt domain-containing protein n=2 Tax=Iodidimonas nitroreducens TaxID=1236968 RepID=A0A5A7N5N7_9PROT|nr:hypothetical protein JCM17846_06470 [Iodidimonas nitroreducens]
MGLVPRLLNGSLKVHDARIDLHHDLNSFRILESHSMSSLQPNGDDPIDLAHLDNFTSGDKTLQSDVLKLFLDHVPAYLDQLDDTTSDQRKEQLHRLKGTARSVGAWPLAKLAEKAEQADFDEQLPLIRAMREEFARLKAFLP